MKKKLKKRKNGYTIAELLTVVAIFVIIGSIITGILSSTLRGTSKTKTSNALSQNGEYALSRISEMITNSDGIISFGSSSDCIVPSPTPYLSATTFQLKEAEGGTITVTCHDNNAQDPFSGTISSSSASIGTNPSDSNTVSLIDTSQVSLFSSQDDPDWCEFRCFQQDPFTAPRMEVSFKLKQKQGTNSDQVVSSLFNTSVTFRNFK